MAAGDDNFVATFGEFCTDRAQHAMTKVAGEVAFTINLGATDPAILAAARKTLMDAVVRIERERRVEFELGAEVGTAPVPFDPHLIGLLEASAQEAGHRSLRIPRSIFIRLLMH